MADLSKIKLNGTEYDLKDAVARESIPTKISDLTDKMFGIAWLNTSNDSNRYIYCNNVSFSHTGDSYFSSPFLFMFKRSTLKSGTVTLTGSGNFTFYDINNNHATTYSATDFMVFPNSETLKYGVLYIGYLSDGIIHLYPLAKQTDVNSAIAAAISDINQFEVAIVTDLPTTDIDTHTIYFKSNSSSGNNVYDEYMYISSNWELIGSTAVDLSGYLQNSDIADWAKQTNKPTYTASEVGALPSTYTAPITSVNTDTGDVKTTFYVNFSGDSTNGYTADKTFTEIENAYNNGYSIQAIYNSMIFKLAMISSGGLSFSRSASNIISTFTWAKQANTINYSNSNIQTMITNNLNNISTPTSDTMAVNKKYVDDSVSTISVPTKTSDLTNDSGYLTSYTETDPTVPAWAKAESKPTYTAAEVGALPDSTIIPTVPTNVSAFTNDAGYLTSYTETDPTVPAWAKASTKPTYTATEVGAAASSHVHGNVKNDGTITVNTSMANGDRLLFSDASDSSKIKNTSITIGTSTTQYLANNGTWQNLPTVSVSQTLTSGTEIGSINNTKLYAPTPYDDSALAARVTALEQLEWATYYSGRSNPSSSQGQNGDIYLQY